MTARQQVFIVSTGRCGSTLLSRLLRSHKDVLSLSEVWPNRVNLPELFSDEEISGREFWRLMVTEFAPDIYKVALCRKTQVAPDRLRERNYIRRIALPSLTENWEALYEDLERYVLALPAKRTSLIIEDMFCYISAYLGKKVWVERTGASLDFLGRWRVMWPNARYIHLYRDGRDCAVSMSKHPAFRVQVKRDEKDNSSSFYCIRPLDPDGFSIEDFDRWQIPLRRFGELWNRMIVSGLSELRHVPEGNVLNIRYEDLVEKPEEWLRLALRHIMPELETDGWLEAAAREIRPAASRWHSLDEATISELSESCREGLELLGYR